MKLNTNVLLIGQNETLSAVPCCFLSTLSFLYTCIIVSVVVCSGYYVNYS